MSDFTSVKVVRVPGASNEVTLDAANPTIEDALDAAGVTLGENEKVSLNGADASPDDSVTDGDKVLVSKGAKGNA